MLKWDTLNIYIPIHIYVYLTILLAGDFSTPVGGLASFCSLRLLLTASASRAKRARSSSPPAWCTITLVGHSGEFLGWKIRSHKIAVKNLDSFKNAYSDNLMVQEGK